MLRWQTKYQLILYTYNWSTLRGKSALHLSPISLTSITLWYISNFNYIFGIFYCVWGILNTQLDRFSTEKLLVDSYWNHRVRNLLYIFANTLFDIAKQEHWVPTTQSYCIKLEMLNWENVLCTITYRSPWSDQKFHAFHMSSLHCIEYSGPLTRLQRRILINVIHIRSMWQQQINTLKKGRMLKLSCFRCAYNNGKTVSIICQFLF